MSYQDRWPDSQQISANTQFLAGDLKRYYKQPPQTYRQSQSSILMGQAQSTNTEFLSRDIQSSPQRVETRSSDEYQAGAPNMEYLSSNLHPSNQPPQQGYPSQQGSANMEYLSRDIYRSLGSQQQGQSPYTNVEYLSKDLQRPYGIQQHYHHGDIASPPHNLNHPQHRVLNQKNPVFANDLMTYNYGSSTATETEKLHSCFQYSPLPETKQICVRLIKLDSSNSILRENSEIYCQMIAVDPRDIQGRYICLSYCWGTGGKTRSVHIRNSEPGAYHRPLPITENLYCALKSLQSSDRYANQWIWIDMISINQNDLSERAKQVVIMKNIYDAAKEIVVWLGGSTAALNALPRISWIYQSFLTATGFQPASLIGSEGLKFNQGHLDLLKNFATNDASGDFSMETYELLAQFFSLPWFRRAWVLQEASSHRTVTARVGHHTLPFDSIIVAAFWQSFLTRRYTSTPEFVLKRATSDQGYLPELWLNLLHTRIPRGLSIVELVCRARAFEASDPRDKVFAMLGLANDIHTSSGSLPSYLAPNYSKPKDVVYMDFAKGVIAESGSLDILSAVDTFTVKNNDGTSASWMPNLDVPIATIRGFGFPKKYDAAFHTAAVCGDPAGAPSLDTLSLSGFVIDTVSSTISSLLTLSPQLRLQMESLSNNAVKHLWSEFTAGKCNRNSSEKLQTLQAFVNTLTAAGFAVPRSFPEYPLGQVVPPQDIPSIILDFAAYWARTDSTFSLLGLENAASLVENAKTGDADQFAVLAGKACHERKFFLTGKSRMGLCPRSTRPGDKVVVLYGGSVPYVLRQKTRHTWTFVGECYVDGLMFGEAQKIKASLNIEDKVFHIQ